MKRLLFSIVAAASTIAATAGEAEVRATLQRVFPQGSIDDLTVYILLYPLESTHPGATDKSKAVWCAKNRLAAWDAVMSTGAVPAARADCDNPIAKIVEFGNRHRITGTPTTILQDGRRRVGAVPRDELEAQLQKAAQQAATTRSNR